jgi:Anti-sigma-K factor rskA
MAENISNQELLAGFAMGDLNPAEMETLRQLLDQQPDLQIEIDRYAEAFANIAQVAIASPTDSLRSRTLDQIQPQNSLSKRRVYPFIAFASLILAASLGFYSYLLRQELNLIEAQFVQRDAIAMLQEPNTSLIALKGMDSALTAAGNLVTTPGQKQGVLVIRNLPTLAPNRVYFVWAVVNGKKVACGEFAPNSEGVVLTKVLVPDAKTESLVITIEDSYQIKLQPNQPQGKMVMSSDA